MFLVFLGFVLRILGEIIRQLQVVTYGAVFEILLLNVI